MCPVFIFWYSQRSFHTIIQRTPTFNFTLTLWSIVLHSGALMNISWRSFFKDLPLTCEDPLTQAMPLFMSTYDPFSIYQTVTFQFYMSGRSAMLEKVQLTPDASVFQFHHFCQPLHMLAFCRYNSNTRSCTLLTSRGSGLPF